MFIMADADCLVRLTGGNCACVGGSPMSHIPTPCRAAPCAPRVLSSDLPASGEDQALIFRYALRYNLEA